MRIQFVGQAPSRETDGKPPFTGKCGQFLAELLGTTQEQMLLDHDFLNVLDHWPGAGIKGDKFPIPEAKVAARRKLEQLRGRVVSCSGTTWRGRSSARPFVILNGTRSGIQKILQTWWCRC